MRSNHFGSVFTPAFSRVGLRFANPTYAFCAPGDANGTTRLNLSFPTSLIGNPVSFLFPTFGRRRLWIPASAGMTNSGVVDYFYAKAVLHYLRALYAF